MSSQATTKRWIAASPWTGVELYEKPPNREAFEVDVDESFLARIAAAYAELDLIDKELESLYQSVQNPSNPT